MTSALVPFFLFTFFISQCRGWTPVINFLVILVYGSSMIVLQANESVSVRAVPVKNVPFWKDNQFGLKNQAGKYCFLASFTGRLAIRKLAAWVIWILD